MAARQIEDCQGESVIEFKNRKKIERQQEWKDKTLHGQSLRQTDGEAGKERWMWLKGTGLKVKLRGPLHEQTQTGLSFRSA